MPFVCYWILAVISRCAVGHIGLPLLKASSGGAFDFSLAVVACYYRHMTKLFLFLLFLVFSHIPCSLSDKAQYQPVNYACRYAVYYNRP